MFMDFILRHALFAQTIIDISPLPSTAADNNRVSVILTLVFTIIGGISLLIITIAGFRYVVSHGDPSIIAQAKNAIIYALVGLVVSVAAVGIINFVVGRIG